jgi:SNF2 family DNA or RNA helicase
MWFDAARNLVIYDTPRAAELAAQVPGAVRLHNGYVACEASLYNLQLLRYFGFVTPQPMDVAYDWPGRYTPFAAQRVTANFLSIHPRAFVLNDMGTGKTLAALWAADFVMVHNPGVRCLIVAPLSTLERVWADAIYQNLLGRRKCVVLHGSAAKRAELLGNEADFYIVNYDGVEVLQKELAARSDIRMCIVDEASAYRNRTTERHRLARRLLAAKDYLWLMTGTPTPNGPTDAYGMAKLVNNCFGEGWGSYHDRVMQKVSLYKWVPKAGAHAEAHKLLQPAVRFAISDCVDLPPCTVQSRDVELSPAQATAYKAMKKDLQIMAAKGPITAQNEAVLRLKLLQISCGAIYGADREIHHVDAAPRLKALREIMEQCNEKIIVFAPFTSVVHMLHRELKKDYSVEVINGEVSAKQRNEVFSSFMDSAHPRVLVADPGTMSHGLTLTAASTIVWYAPTDRTETYLQANKRIDRPGQTKATTIVQLAATPVEREIYRRLEANETMQGLVLALAKGKL